MPTTRRGRSRIHRLSLDALLEQLATAGARRAKGESLPLFGVPFAVKDNIDVAGLPTTAGCPAFEYVPARSAASVERLVAAGAIVLGKTNLDQFATGLVGVRSPYGICRSAFDPRYISGGSSSGSALAVAHGLTSFALGTDTAGSGRVPAALNNVVGLKPTRGLVSTRGVVPACRSLDVVSIFAGSVADARTVLDVVSAFDVEDRYSRDENRAREIRFSEPLRVGVPRHSDLEFFGDAAAAQLYERAVRQVEALGAVSVEIDFAPFRDAAGLLYGGPWVAERLFAAGALLEKEPGAIQPIVRTILEGARGFSARDVFEGMYRLADALRRAEAEWKKMDVLLVPTVPTTYTVVDVEHAPVECNTRLGHYTNFVNLMDLSAIAIPAGLRPDGLPSGVTLVAPAFADRDLALLASRLHASYGGNVGITDEPVLGAEVPSGRDGDLLIAVAGAHLAGEPLNHQLTSRRGHLVRSCRTSEHYRFYALRTEPPKPGLVYDPDFVGAGIEVEVWSLDEAAFGSFVDEVPAPLAIGTVLLEDGMRVSGFVCEPHALRDAMDITHFGGWRRYRAAVTTK